MTFQAKHSFPHRHNKDGVIDSICSDCLVTVASVTAEDELAQHEEAHVCSPIRLRQLGADRARRLSVNPS